LEAHPIFVPINATDYANRVTDLTGTTEKFTLDWIFTEANETISPIGKSFTQITR
jgi:hypothetical protein